MSSPLSATFSPARVSVVTLGVSDLTRSRAFYLDGLGFTAHASSQDDITFIECAGIVLSLYPRAKLSREARVSEGGIGFPGFTLGRCLSERAAVDETLRRAERAGAIIHKPAAETFWGGYSGYFADPDGYLWEVAYHSAWQFDKCGRLLLRSPT